MMEGLFLNGTENMIKGCESALLLTGDREVPEPRAELLGCAVDQGDEHQCDAIMLNAYNAISQGQ